MDNIAVDKKGILMPFEIAGIEFRNPFYVSSGPASKSVEQLLRAQEYGWAGASIKLTFDPVPYINLEPRYGWFKDLGYFSFSAEKRLSIEEGLKLIEEGRRRTRDFVLLANITYSGKKGPEGWANMAARFEASGAHIIELNMCCPNMSFNVAVSAEITEGEPLSGASLGGNEKAVSTIVKEVKKAVSIPVFVKLTPEGGRIAQVAKASLKAGADAVVSVANRLGIPPINIHNPKQSVYSLQREPSMSCLSGPWIKPLALRDVYEIRKLVGPEYVVVGSGGVSTFQDAVEMSMAGADLIAICTGILVNGFGFLEELIKELNEYLGQTGHSSLREVRDVLVESITPSSRLTIDKGYARLKDESLSAPCVYDCPAHIPIQACLKMLAEGNLREAFRQITSKSPLQSICSQICTHPCQSRCIRGEIDEPVLNREIEKFVIEYGSRKGWKSEIKPAAGKQGKVAIIGSGPAGLSTAYDLAKIGYRVTIFESEKVPGGMLRLAVPRFRLPRNLIREAIETIKKLGVTIKTGVTFGKDITVDRLKVDGFKAIFVGIGAQNSLRLNIPGEGAEGNLTSLDFLKRVLKGENPEIGERVAVIGGGFTAIDSARMAIRLGAKEVFILYRRTKDEMTAMPEDVMETEEEGIKVMYLVSPKEIIAQDGKVTGLTMVNHVLGEKDTSSRRRPVEVEGTDFVLKVNTVISAIGQGVELECQDINLEMTPSGSIAHNEDTGTTNIEGVFVGGDAATGPSTIIRAIASGKRASVSIDKFLARENALLQYEAPLTIIDKKEVLERRDNSSRRTKAEIKLASPDKRRNNFGEYTKILTEDEAVKEAKRCLNCGCGTGCAICERICLSFAPVSSEDNIIRIDKEKCVGCSICAQLCPNSNIEMVKAT